jgi:ferric-dicitrate binding protein FerR (iron transport regulator)
VALLPSYDLRASDLDRERAVEFLKAHYTEGRLAEDELAWRTEAAYRAAGLGELDRLTADLPAFARARHPRRRRRIGATALVLLGMLVVLLVSVPPETWFALGIAAGLAFLLVAFVAPIAIPLLLLAWIVHLIVRASRPAPPRVGWR